MTNSHGKVCDGISDTFFCSSTTVAESRAINASISLASTQQVSTLIHSECLALINMIKGSLFPWLWYRATIGAHISQGLKNCPWVSVDYTPRENNDTVDLAGGLRWSLVQSNNCEIKIR
ncbi:hypothetical protein LINPERHAP2_LOCUS23020 [Linum perenne]